jgi:hypothetical protein
MVEVAAPDGEWCKLFDASENRIWFQLESLKQGLKLTDDLIRSLREDIGRATHSRLPEKSLEYPSMSLEHLMDPGRRETLQAVLLSVIQRVNQAQ